MANAIILCSGGLDSVVAAHYVKKKMSYGEIIILFFDYGQRAIGGERRAAKKCAEALKAKFFEVKLALLGETAGDLLNEERASELSLEDLKDTKEESMKWYVPHRNLIFLSHAMSLSESLALRDGARYDIFVGFKNEGKEGFPDTSREFVLKINELREISSEKKFEIVAPLIEKDKEDIVLLGKELGVDFGSTWSCYVSGKEQCGTCLACRLRQEGFRWANIEDPTTYLK